MPNSTEIENSAKIEEACQVIQDHWTRRPLIGIILGTGLSRFRDEMQVEQSLDYTDIPHFRQSTALGHAGRLLFGTVRDVPVITMDGRLHRYEGWSTHQITFPIRAMKRLGAKWLFVSSASGGLRPDLQLGDVLVLDDHIDLTGAEPCQYEPLQPRRLDPKGSGRPNYDMALRDIAMSVARRAGIAATLGVYASMTGPNYETRAEYRMLRRMGADIVGMSTVSEVRVASRIGLRTLAMSVVTNVCRPDSLRATDGQAVIIAAEKAEWKLRTILLGIVEHLLSTIRDENHRPGGL